MYVAEYYLVNKESLTTVRGAILYYDYNDFLNNINCLVIFTFNEGQLGFPKRSQRKNIWKKLILKIKPKNIHIEKLDEKEKDRDRIWKKSIITKNIIVKKSELFLLKNKLINSPNIRSLKDFVHGKEKGVKS